MAHFFQLQDRMHEVTDEYFAMVQNASYSVSREVAAVIRVQSTFRASKVRNCWYAVRGASVLIQRVLRGYLARARTRAKRFERQRYLNSLFFHHTAAVCQRFFRGWLSRRHLHDYYGRKAYLEKVGKAGEWTKDCLYKQQQKQIADAKADDENKMRQDFDNLASELHHLVSTKTCPGVYNPPYNDALPRAFDKPIEQHLRDSCRVVVPRSLRQPRHRIAIASVSPRGYGGPGGACMGGSHAEHYAAASGRIAGPPGDLPDRCPHRSRSANVGRMQRIQGPFRSREQIEVANSKASNNYRSIQAAAPYDAVEHDRKLQDRLSKLTRVSPNDFVAPGLPSEKQAPSSVHVHVPFRERPVEMRNEYVELPKIRDKPPFFTALPRDKDMQDYHDHHLLPSGYV